MGDGKTLTARFCELTLVSLCRFITGIRAQWRCSPLSERPRIYYANHSSHLDGLVIWAGLPPEVRRTTWLVAARDYWQASWLRRYISAKVFNVVLVDRKIGTSYHQDMLAPLAEVLERGDSLIIFPEGTRGSGEEIATFKSGIFHLAGRFPEAELIPVYLENLNRVMPRGSMLMVPIICSSTFGPALESPETHEGKQEFLARARQALTELSS